MLPHSSDCFASLGCTQITERSFKRQAKSLDDRVAFVQENGSQSLKISAFSLGGWLPDWLFACHFPRSNATDFVATKQQSSTFARRSSEQTG
jgi:hypothetical protein